MGCGECSACRVTEDCGACSTCLLQLPHDVASGLFCKCERRRCLRIVEKVSGADGVGPRLTLPPGPHSPGPVHHASGPPTEPRVWSMPGLSNPRGLWPLPSLPSPSPPWSQAPVEVRPAALPTSESGWRGRCWWGQGWGRARSSIKLGAAAAAFQLALPTSCLLFSFTPLSPAWPHLPAPVCQHLAHRLRRHHQRCQRRPPLAVAPPAVSAPSHTLSVPCMLSAFLGGEGPVPAWCHQA